MSDDEYEFRLLIVDHVDELKLPLDGLSLESTRFADGFDSEEECFGLQFGHGVGLSLWERPIISRLNSLEHPAALEAGMVIALETYCPARDGYSAARIEEEVLVTASGNRILTRFPADQLLVAGTVYVRGIDLSATQG